MNDRVQFTLATERRLDVFADPMRVRQAVRTLLRLCAGLVVAFHLGGDHLHNVLTGDREAIRRAMAHLARALERELGVPFGGPRETPVNGRRHAERVLPYVFRQGQHHGHPYDDALWEGASFQFEVGTAYADEFAPLGTAAVIPNISSARLLGAVDLQGVSVRPASSEELRRAGAEALRDAASAAALLPDLRPNRRASAGSRDHDPGVERDLDSVPRERG